MAIERSMSDCCDLKCDREFSKINDPHFQHLGVIKIAKSSSNLALYFRMRFPILVHFAMKDRINRSQGKCFNNLVASKKHLNNPEKNVMNIFVHAETYDIDRHIIFTSQ